MDPDGSKALDEIQEAEITQPAVKELRRGEGKRLN
jgi:hypothetical protein